MLASGEVRFAAEDLDELTEMVADAWLFGADGDWSAPAGTLEWSCRATADHAVDCVYAPAFFLASRRRDAYPEVGLDLELGPKASPALLVESLRIATRILVAVVGEAAPDVQAIIFRRPSSITAAPPDFLPRGALELILHAHDVCAGLGVAFEPPLRLCERLREHTRPWPMWDLGWRRLGRTDDPWDDLLQASGRMRSVPSPGST